ncbi:hypothetical protein AO262_07895 [Pseudomonas fluorescens ABAC62]|nr:hypothetical protein AO262_07895 [Pseudomonas fluorescens ABAC62]
MQRVRHHFALGFTLGQQATQHQACLVGHATFGKTRQVFTGKPIMQKRHGLVSRGQRSVHIGAFENQRVVRCTKL